MIHMHWIEVDCYPLKCFYCQFFYDLPRTWQRRRLIGNWWKIKTNCFLWLFYQSYHSIKNTVQLQNKFSSGDEEINFSETTLVPLGSSF